MSLLSVGSMMGSKGLRWVGEGRNCCAQVLSVGRQLLELSL